MTADHDKAREWAEQVTLRSELWRDLDHLRSDEDLENVAAAYQELDGEAGQLTAQRDEAQRKLLVCLDSMGRGDQKISSRLREFLDARDAHAGRARRAKEHLSAVIALALVEEMPDGETTEYWCPACDRCLVSEAEGDDAVCVDDVNHDLHAEGCPLEAAYRFVQTDDYRHGDEEDETDAGE